MRCHSPVSAKLKTRPRATRLGKTRPSARRLSQHGAEQNTAYRELVLQYADIAAKARAILRAQIKAKGLSDFDAAGQLLALLDGQLGADTMIGARKCVTAAG
jgi:hypothetical protein